MKRNVLAYLLLLVLLLTACGRWQKADMLRQLNELQATNQSDSLLTNDSLAHALADYFDDYGTPNERMLAHYLLARTYADMGETPQALDEFHTAADCADTTATDCDYKVLARVHAQTARLFRFFQQPRNTLIELSRAIHFADAGSDSLLSVECFSEKAYAYGQLGLDDSVLCVIEKASARFAMLGNMRRAAAIRDGATIALLKRHQYNKAKDAIDDYRMNSGYVDAFGNVDKGRETFYYKCGLYYLYTNMLDSAEFFFRKELQEGKDVNNQIGGRMGLQLLYEKKALNDSLAKYAIEGYTLSDSVYSLSESQTIQTMQALYDYKHHQLLAEQKANEVKTIKIISGCVLTVLLCIILLLICIWRIREKKKSLEAAVYRSRIERLSQVQADILLFHEQSNQSAMQIIERKHTEIVKLKEQMKDYTFLSKEYKRLSLDERLQQSQLAVRLREKADSNPPVQASSDDTESLRILINNELPQFFETVNRQERPLSFLEYNVCMLTRIQLQSVQIAKLMDITEGYTSTLKSRIYQKITGEKGTAKNLEEYIMRIN